MRLIDFEGKTINIEKITAIDEVRTISTGSMACSWEFGFTVKLEGNEINILYPSPRNFGYPGGISREEYKKKAEDLRRKFIEKVRVNS